MKVDPLTSLPARSSSDQEWVNYFDVLKNNFGKKEAKAIWLKAWSLRGTPAANTNFLRESMDKRGIKISAGSILGSVYDEGKDLVDSVGGIFSFGKNVTIALTVIVVAGVAIAVHNIAKNPGQAAGLALKA